MRFDKVLLCLLASFYTLFFMRSLIKNIALYALALFLASKVFSGVVIIGGLTTLIVAGFVLSLLRLIVAPILRILTLPLNIASMGAFSIIINGIVLYLLTIFVSQITISPFLFEGTKINGFVVPPIYFNAFFSYIVTAFFISLIVLTIKWVIKE